MSEKFYEVDLKLLREQIEKEAMAHDISDKMEEDDQELSEMMSDMYEDDGMLHEQDEESEEEDYTQSDDYHVDEDGTEWWKDEVGVWWWRGPDDEEWSEYVD